MTRPRRDYRNTTSGPERSAQGRGQRQGDDRSGAIAWFNCRQRHAAGEQPNAMTAALAAAGVPASGGEDPNAVEAFGDSRRLPRNNARTTP